MLAKKAIIPRRDDEKEVEERRGEAEEEDEEGDEAGSGSDLFTQPSQPAPFSQPVRSAMTFESAQKRLHELSRLSCTNSKGKVKRMKDFASIYWLSYLPYA